MLNKPNATPPRPKKDEAPDTRSPARPASAPSGARPAAPAPANKPAPTGGKPASAPTGNRPPARPSAPGGNRPPQNRPGGGRPSQGRPPAGRPPQNRPPAGAPPKAPAPRPEAVPARPKELELPQIMTVRDLANQMAVSPIELIKGLMNAGIMANINQQIDYETAAIVAEDMGYKVTEFKAPEPVVVEEEKKAEPTVQRRVYTEEEKKHLRERPPVVTILGHVDHGKTSLLDAIRTTNVTAGEAGGITQHIGAYQVEAQNKPITFLDTPGHAAFTAMRARGASVTDIVVLVVAADDGVQPQTREAIDHAHAAKVPIIVALNKIDVPSANPDRVKQQLSDVGLVPEEWGGDTVVVPVSAKQKLGINTLLDMILLVAEMADLRADPRLPAQGTVIEGKLDRSRGPMVTLLVQDGTLKVGDAVLVGHTYGKIRAMLDQQGKPLKRALPASPAVITGLREVPAAGDHFEIVESEREAREKAEQRLLGDQAAKAQPAQVLTLDEIYQRAQEGSAVALNLILKADVDGSMEPIKNSLEKLEVGKLKVKFVHLGVGTVSESDVMLAVASQAVIIGFGVNVEPSAQRLAETEGISIRSYNIIYRIVEDIQLALTGMLEPEIKEVVQGQAIVRNVFNIPRQGKIAGAQVTEGKALRNGLVRVKRNNAVIHEGKVGSLKRFTEDVREVTAGMECGVGIDGFATVQVDDVLEFYTKEKSKPSE